MVFSLKVSIFGIIFLLSFKSINNTLGTLYITATPIGNMDDISRRAVEILKQVNYIACEDTRTSGQLLDHLRIQTPTFSFHQHNEHQKKEYLIELLQAGHDVALISDAGMPGISDPGFLAVRAAHNAHIPVSVIPGPDAVSTALVASGLPCERYIFEGFVPRKKGRHTFLKQITDEQRTVVMYESCHRIQKLLLQLGDYVSENRMIAVCRELTKKFEEIIRGPLSRVREQVNNQTTIKGEFVVVIAGKDYTD